MKLKTLIHDLCEYRSKLASDLSTCDSDSADRFALFLLEPLAVIFLVFVALVAMSGVIAVGYFIGSSLGKA